MDKEKHPTAERLFLGAMRARPSIESAADLARALQVSEQNITNWSSRGVSKEGALSAQAILGVSATWILNGDEPILIGSFRGWPFEFEQARFTRLPPDIKERAAQSVLNLIETWETASGLGTRKAG